MNTPIFRTPRRGPLPRRQRGTMLIISLIVLVAMTLAGIATMRSVDTATVMAGNIAFRQSALNSVDQGIQAGYGILVTPWSNVSADLNKDGLGLGTAGYFSSVSLNEPNWSDPNAWTKAAQLPADAAGNVVWFIVERMCTVANCKPGDTCVGTNNLCGSTPGSPAGASSREGDDNFRPSEAFTTPAPHYRITARAVGPRNSIAIVQTLTR